MVLALKGSLFRLDRFDRLQFRCFYGGDHDRRLRRRGRGLHSRDYLFDVRYWFRTEEVHSRQHAADDEHGADDLEELRRTQAVMHWIIHGDYESARHCGGSAADDRGDQSARPVAKV